ncbi:MAG: PKD domain-containing protein [Cyclobacteriaceae bacterium]|nr:PKD domain-containing protein [Cyclobacteriaceae bacterium]
MKKFLIFMIWATISQVLITGCKEDNPELGNPPTEEDALFTFSPSNTSPNILIFNSASNAFLKKWDFGNGETAEGNGAEIAYPFQGVYTVKLTVFTSGGSVTTTQEINIANTDLNLLKPIYSLLTGGSSKTWIIDATRSGHFGVGPNPSDGALGDVPNYYAAQANEKNGAGYYDDEFTFVLNGLAFTSDTKGDVFLNNKYTDVFPGAFANAGDFTAPYTPPAGMKWAVSGPDNNLKLTISNNGFIGYYSGGNVYKIVKAEENELILRAEDVRDPALAWYQRLIPKGFTPPPPPPPATSTLPITFEGPKPPFNGFGGSTYEVVDNPSKTGINTSNKVGRYIKGLDGNWAGIETTLDAKLDFSTKTTLRYKVYTPVTGRALFKIEDKANNTINVERFVDITVANQWTTLSFDFTGTAANTYDKVALFLDFDNNAGGTFFIDDIEQVVPGCPDADTESVNPATGINMTMNSQFFGAFGGISTAIVANPFKTGINTSCSVNSYIKSSGGCEVWAGSGFLLPTAIDFATATKKKFKLKVYAVNQTTTVTLRLERLAFPDTEPSEERTATITATGQWQELTFDFSNVNTNTFKNVLIYFERGAACDGDTYYFDDLIQIE